MSLLFSTGVIAASGLAKGAPGMVLLKPTSIAHSGTSASIGANGQVTFTAVTSLSLNGVFSADFDNYVVWWNTSSSGNTVVYTRLRASGADATAGNYTVQRLESNGSTVEASRATSATQTVVGYSAGSTQNGSSFTIYGPHLAQPTAFRSVTVSGLFGAYFRDDACTHSLSSSYDGFTFFPDANNLTGKLAVYGVRS